MLTVGLVQIAELSWPHRKREQYELRDGVLVPKLMGDVKHDTEFVYLPLSAGMLQAYVQRHASRPDSMVFLPIIFNRVPIATAIDALSPADVVGFSVYVWNVNLSLKMAASLKEQRPDTLIVFGGPQVPDHPREFLAANPQVDLVVHGEGEKTFLDILERTESRDWSTVPSISYRAADGTVVTSPRRPRTQNLDELPSPYLDGIFNPLFAAHPDKKWLVMWETTRGCPFSCSYCDWGSAVGAKVSRFSIERINAEISWMVDHRVSNLFVCDANFGLLPRDVDIARQLVATFEAARLPVAISIQNAKNASERSFAIQRILSESKLVHFGATLSLQSVSAQTLAAIRRSNISLDAFHELHSRFRDVGVETYTDLIVGLPGETYDSFAAGLGDVIDRGQHNRIAFYNCSILPNAEMGSPAYQQEHALERVPVPIVHEHERLDRTDRNEAQEFLDTIIATRTLPRTDWIRTRTFAWLVDCLHFNRVLNVVAITMREVAGIGYRELYERIAAASSEQFPTLSGLIDIFRDRALRIQSGEPEFVPSDRWLGVWWPADQYALITLVNEYRLAGLYEETRTLILNMLLERGREDVVSVLDDAVALNHAMLRVPKMVDDVELTLSSNVLEIVQGAIAGRRVALERERATYHIDRTSTVWLTRAAWCEDVIVQYYKRQSFSYNVRRVPTSTYSMPPQLAHAVN